MIEARQEIEKRKTGESGVTMLERVSHLVRRVSVFGLFWFSCVGALAGTYTTSFPLTENPMSESGNWINGYTDGIDWADVATENGLAFGLQPGPIGYDDATALLTGIWYSNQIVTAIVHTTNQLGGNVAEEVELRLRSSLSAHVCTGYEVSFGLRNDSSAYAGIVRWNGPLGDFTYLKTDSGPQYILNEGDEVKATVIGNTISVYIRGTLVMEATDNTYTSGNPGIGFFLSGTTGVNTDYGFTEFTASDGLDSPVIWSQPQTQIASLGANATFAVVATGASPLFYQWYFNDTNAINGATNDQVTVNNVQNTDVGSYQVSVSNAFGTVLSENAYLFIAKTYTTTFPLNEAPIYEGGNWVNGYTDGLDWSDVVTANGLAFGLQSGLNGSDDATALLTGIWGPNQVVTATVHTANQPPAGGIFEEVELRLRSSIAEHRCAGYEVTFGLRTDSSAYLGITRWNGALGDFMPLNYDAGPQYVINEGDEVKASVIGDTIRAYIRGTLVMEATDSTYSSGLPGLGFFLGGTTGVNSDYGFTSFSASSDAQPPLIVSQPQGQIVNINSDATFVVGAIGTSPISYQWYFNTTNMVGGATNNQLVLTNVQDTVGGLYQAWLSNSFGAVLSDNAQLVVNHLPVPASPTLERYWGAGFRVQEALLLGSDPDGDPVSLICVGPLSAEGALVAESQGWVSYIPPAGLTNDDSFGYTVSDGKGGTAIGTATVVSITNRGPVLSIAWDANSTGPISLVGNGIADRSYTIQVSGDLLSGNWQAVASVMSDDLGVFAYQEPLSAGSTNRFYRVVSP